MSLCRCRAIVGMLLLLGLAACAAPPMGFAPQNNKQPDTITLTMKKGISRDHCLQVMIDTMMRTYGVKSVDERKGLVTAPDQPIFYINGFWVLPLKAQYVASLSAQVSNGTPCVITVTSRAKWDDGRAIVMGSDQSMLNTYTTALVAAIK